MSKTSTSRLSISGESGGGQLPRSALSLTLVTGRAFRISDETDNKHNGTSHEQTASPSVKSLFNSALI